MAFDGMHIYLNDLQSLPSQWQTIAAAATAAAVEVKKNEGESIETDTTEQSMC